MNLTIDTFNLIPIDVEQGWVRFFFEVSVEVLCVGVIALLVRSISPETYASFFSKKTSKENFATARTSTKNVCPHGLSTKQFVVRCSQTSTYCAESLSHPTSCNASGCDTLATCFGTVKRYSVLNEYGFILREGFSEELWFCKSDVRQDDVTSLRAGAVVRFAVHQSRMGNSRARFVEASFDGTIKWFDTVNEFGFISCPNSHFTSDLWFSMCDVITPVSWLKEGAAVRFEAYQGNNDRMRARHLRVEESEYKYVEALVKFFSLDKGYGFIECPEEGCDVRFLKDDVPVVHQKFLTAGVPLRFKLDTSSTRPRVRDVKVVLLPEVEGTVKSFSDHSSYGFVSCDGIDGDIWFAAASVEGVGSHRPLGPGMRVVVEIFQTADGKYRAFRMSRKRENATARHGLN
jgi:cold shock CspA family protein